MEPVVLIHLYQPSTTLPSHLSTFVWRWMMEPVVLIHLYQPSTTLPSHLSTFVCGGG